MRKKRIYSGEEEASSINISPLIDMVFILLIFFIVTSVFKEDNSVNIQKPSNKFSDENQDEILNITLTKDSKIFISNTQTTLSNLPLVLKRNACKNLLINADKNLNLDFLMKVHSLAKQAGVEKIAIGVENE